MSNHSRVTNLICFLMLLFVPRLLLGVDSGAMLYASGKVTVDESSITRPSALFAGQTVKTRDDSSFTLLFQDARIDVGANSSLAYEPSGIAVEYGRALVQGSRRLVTQFAGLTISPAADKAKYQLTRVDRTVQIAALEGLITVSDGTHQVQLAAGKVLSQVPMMMAQTVAPALRISILEGEGALNNIRQRTAREPIVQVNDENNRPVSGAAVLFLLPNGGPGGEFASGARSLTVVTDQTGRARASGFRPNGETGAFVIQVVATLAGLRAEAVIRQTNIAGAEEHTGKSEAGTHGVPAAPAPTPLPSEGTGTSAAGTHGAPSEPAPPPLPSAPAGKAQAGTHGGPSEPAPPTGPASSSGGGIPGWVIGAIAAGSVGGIIGGLAAAGTFSQGHPSPSAP